MPATRHVRREGRGSYNPIALPSLPSLSAMFSFSNSNSNNSNSNSNSNSTAASATDNGASRTNTWASTTSSSTAVSSSSATTAVSSSSATTTVSPSPQKKHSDASSTFDFDGKLPFGLGIEEDKGEGKGYSTATTPFFLRRSAGARRADDLLQRGLDSSRLLQSISSSMDLETIQVVAGSCGFLSTVLAFSFGGRRWDAIGVWVAGVVAYCCTSVADALATASSVGEATQGSYGAREPCHDRGGTSATVRTNRTQTRMLLERVHQIVHALINLCGDAQVQRNGGYTNTTGVGLAPAMARAIERFTQTLTALHTLLQAQSEAGMISRILRHAETRDELRRCDEALGEALELFSVKTGLLTHAALGGARRSATQRHEEIVAALRAKGHGRGVGAA
ncbi:hypothetical protein DFH08DRAFT_1073523 [Mycena albidolilacea]|uniref:Uncharacterized protein n=1 Tax=Mycena albidolilacea TaxID=1033008 RepID=A0AAD7ALK0_9AGAR|nr:hypothetical protein DFH08DRAFT_1073523 [Mycena albidolilacea]